MIRTVLAAMAVSFSAPAALSQDAPPPVAFEGPMTGERLGAIVASIDPALEATPNSYQFAFAERSFILVFDETAGRMRLMTPVAETAALGPDVLMRALQANFDAVLDARYAIAGDVMWSVFIHPLPSLTDERFESALVQTAIAAETFGTTFTSGEFVFGGGDSQGLHQELIDQLEQSRRERSL
ncbi:MAG: hypothetical protein AAFX03_00620 [Pseudomonadota bacterium]